MVELSVVIPTKNRVHFLDGLLDAIKNQDLNNDVFEVIIVDNNSNDSTWEFLNSKHEKWLRILMEEKPGASSARRKGVENAKGERILFIDDDVIPDRDLFRLHLDAHKRNSKSSFIGRVIFDWEESNDALFLFLANNFLPYWYPNNNVRLDYNHYVTSNASSNRDAILKVGGFDTSYNAWGFEDTDLGFRLQKAGYQLNYLKDAIVKDVGNTDSGDYLRKTIEGGKMRRYFLDIHPELWKENKRYRLMPFIYPVLWLYFHSIGFIIDIVVKKIKWKKKLPLYITLHIRFKLWYHQGKGYVAFRSSKVDGIKSKKT